MNSKDMESPTTPKSTDSNNSSPAVTLSAQTITIREGPLQVLAGKPMSQMTDEELRARVLRIQQLRTSAPTFQAAARMDGGDEGAVAAEEVKSEMSDYL